MPASEFGGSGTVTARTRLFVLLGDPVAHSYSPEIQNAAFRAMGLDGRYLALRCTEEDLPGLLRGVARAGGGGNVTLPHKGAALRAVDGATEAAVRSGAVNTFWLEGSRVSGDNTDVAGFRDALEALLEGPVAGCRALLLGAGGAARAAVVALLDAGGDRIEILNRTPERAEALRDAMGDDRVRVLEGGSAELAEGRWDVLVNATSLGLREGDPLPVDPEALTKVPAVLDMVYRPRGTALVRRATELGLAAEDGGEMLVRQGGASFLRWWGREAPLAVMRDALARAREGATGSGVEGGVS